MEPEYPALEWKLKTKICKAPSNWQELKPHPLSELTEFGAGIDMEAFELFVLEHGYDTGEPIILHDGQVLDGRHKLTVCIKLGMVPTFAEFAGSNPVAFVAKKIHRQHLDQSQRSMLAASMAKLPVGRPPKNGSKEPINGDEAEPEIPSKDGIKFSTSEAAAALNVSESSVKRAKAVLANGEPELVEKVKKGETTVSAAAKEVKAKSVLCDRCKRNGGTQQDCLACAELRKGKKKKPKKKVFVPPDAGDAWEPGDDDENAQKAADADRDADGFVIPVKLKDVFGKDFFDPALDALRTWKKHVSKNLSSYPYLLSADFDTAVKTLLHCLENAKPHVVHQKCKGKGCDQCRASGYLTAWRKKELELQAK